MVKRTYRLYLNDIIQAMNKIEKYSQGLDYDSFVSNDMVIDAVLRNIEVIGEAAAQIPETLKQQYSHIPWKKIIGLRNIVIHEYFGVDLDNIWKIVTENIPDTKPHLVKMLEDLFSMEHP